MDKKFKDPPVERNALKDTIWIDQTLQISHVSLVSLHALPVKELQMPAWHVTELIIYTMSTHTIAMMIVH
jgi:hypothetical protein